MKLKFSVVFISFIYLNVFSQEKTNVVMIVLDDLNDYVGVMGGHPQSKLRTSTPWPIQVFYLTMPILMYLFVLHPEPVL